MADRFQADTSQVDQLADQLHRAGLDLADLDAANADAGREVITASRPPRATGYMATNLTATATGQGVTFASAARYWTFVHWGAPRRNVRARPWYPQAIRANTSDVVAVYAAHARKSLPS